MNTKNEIDELFRQELSDFTVPVTLTTLPIAGLIAKKGLFYKLALLKLNTVTLVAGTAAVTAVATVATIKVVEHYQTKKTTVTHIKANKQTQTSPQLFVDTHKQIITETITQKQQETLKPTKTEIQKITVVCSINEKQSTKNEIAANSQTEIAQTEITKAEPTAAAQQNSATVFKDTAQQVRKIVYVKQKTVVIQDTIVKVIKKVRPRKE